jgi:hypothetical protein
MCPTPVWIWLFEQKEHSLQKKKERKVQRMGALLCLLSLVKFWVFSDIQDYISTFIIPPQVASQCALHPSGFGSLSKRSIASRSSTESGVPSPEIHRVDIDICGLVCDVTRLHVAELSVELLETPTPTSK